MTIRTEVSLSSFQYKKLRYNTGASCICNYYIFTGYFLSGSLMKLIRMIATTVPTRKIQ